MPFALPGTSLANVGAQVAILLCKPAVRRHQRGRSPADGRAFPLYLGAGCHHIYVLLFEVRRGAELPGLGAPHAGVNAAVPF